MTSLLKCVAIDLKISADHNELSNFGNMSKILFGTVQDISTAQDYTPYENNKYSLSMINNSLSTGNMFGDNSISVKGRTTTGTTGLLICKLLQCIDFGVKTIEMPKWDFFQNDLMQKLLHVSSFLIFYLKLN